MKSRKILALMLVCIMSIVVLVGCGGNSSTGTDGEQSAAPQRQFVTVVTGSTGGTYYPVGTILASLWNDKLGDQGVVASAQSSGGSVENLNMLKDGEAQLGIAMANLTLFAYEGQERFADNQFEDVRFIAALWPDVTQFVVTEASGINTLADMKGKRFNVGGAGSGTEYSTRMILEHIGGLTFDDIRPEHLGYSEASSAMQNAQLDGMNAEGGLPTTAVMEVFASRTPVKLLGFNDEDFAKLHAVAPYYGQFTIPGGLYSNVDEDVKTVGVKSAIIGSAKLDDELVYNLVKTMFDYLEEIVGSHMALEYVSLEEAVQGLAPVPLHPGAARFYEEKGITIPADLMPK